MTQDLAGHAGLHLLPIAHDFKLRLAGLTDALSSRIRWLATELPPTSL